MTTVDDIRSITLPSFTDERGMLAVIERAVIGVPIERVFYVQGAVGTVRGEHAHYQCTQVVVCLGGECRVDCYDGRRWNEYVLTDKPVALLVPPGIWAEQRYLREGTVVMVLCDRPYEPDDYIRDRDEFDKYARGGQ